MSAFQVAGPTVTFTADTTAPTTVQCVSSNGVRSPQYLLTNIGTSDVWVSFDAATGLATKNAVIPTGTAQVGAWLLARSQMTLTAPPDAFFTGITSAGTSVVYVTPGYGE